MRLNIHLAKSTVVIPVAAPVNALADHVASKKHFHAQMMIGFGVHFLNGASGLKVVFLLIKNDSRDFLFTLSSGAYYNGGKDLYNILFDQHDKSLWC